MGIAYRMLGSRAEAEDIVQDAYLRWHDTNTVEVRSARAWLTTAVTRLAIDRLRELKIERQSYVGAWLPEPLLDDTAPPADASSELASSLSVAFLALMERLEPQERAAFLLHDVFDTGYEEIARILGRTEATCRQVVSRARTRVRTAHPRVRVSEEVRKNVLQRFVDAVMARDKAGLMQLLAADASWTSDGGGKAKAALKAIHGREHVARFVLGVLRHTERLKLRLVTVNAEAGLALYLHDRLISVMSMVIEGDHIVAVYSVLNPQKLRSAA